MRVYSLSSTGCYKALARYKTLESVGRRGRTPETSTSLVLGWQGLAAPLVCAPLLLRAVTQGWRAGLPQLRAPEICLCVGLTERSSRSGMERSWWIFLHQVSRVLGPWVLLCHADPPVTLVGHPIAVLVCEVLGSIPELRVFQ